MTRGSDRHTSHGRVLLLGGGDVMAGAEPAREFGAEHRHGQRRHHGKFGQARQARPEPGVG